MISQAVLTQQMRSRTQNQLSTQATCLLWLGRTRKIRNSLYNSLWWLNEFKMSSLPCTSQLTNNLRTNKVMLTKRHHPGPLLQSSNNNQLLTLSPTQMMSTSSTYLASTPTKLKLLLQSTKSITGLIIVSDQAKYMRNIYYPLYS